MRELSLFTGAGGGLLGTKLLGWEPIGYVEWNEYCQRVIAARIADGYLPVAPIFTDVCQFIQSGAADQYRGFADVVTAGFPCQPFSVAGQQRAADDERNMWPETCEVIRRVRPRSVLLENVPGLVSCGYLGTVLTDLAALGYVGRWGVLGAADVGAPHRRDRLWIAAYDGSQRVSRNIKREIPRVSAFPWGKDGGGYTDWAKRSNVSEPIIRRMGDGVAFGVDRLRATGNGQVPAVVVRAWEELAA